LLNGQIPAGVNLFKIFKPLIRLLRI
jgi:hypothetical protein